MSDDPALTADDDEWVDTMWTDPAREQLRAAADELIAAIRNDVTVVTGLRGGASEMPQLVAVHEALGRARAVFDDALFDLTGAAPPVVDLYDDELDGDEDDDEPDWSGGVAILQRSDFAFVDEERVIAEGRTAYREVWPDETEADAIARVQDVGVALYEIGHARGPAAWDEVPGLTPLQGSTMFVRLDDVSYDPAEFEGNPLLAFGAGDEILLARRDAPPGEATSR